MTHEDLTTLLDYRYWARDRALDAVERLTPAEFRRDLGNSFGSIRDTLVHLVFAEWFWCSRWEGATPEGQLTPDDFATVRDVRARWSEEDTTKRSCRSAASATAPSSTSPSAPSRAGKTD